MYAGVYGPFAYGPEMMRNEDCTMLAIQKDLPPAVNLTDAGKGASV